jgi:O-antigen/teichoic acid export membrane protein
MERGHPESRASTDTRSLIQGLQWTYISVVVQGFLKLIVLLMLTRMLSPRDFGLLGFALICTNFIERIGQVGIAPALVQIARPTADTIATARLLSVIVGCMCGVVVFLAAGAMASFFHEDELQVVLQVLALGCIVEGLAATPDALLQRELRFKEIMIADNLAYGVGMACVGVALAVSGWGVWALVAAHLTLKLVRFVSLSHFVPVMPPGRLSYRDGIDLLHTGFGFSLGRVLNFFSLQGDNFVVGRLLGVEALGMYNRAYQLMTLPAMYVGQAFERVMFPSMAQKQESHERLVREFLMTLEAITLVALPAGVVMFVLAQEIVTVGFGSHWSAVTPVVSILSFGVFFRTAYKCSDTVVRSVGAVYHYAARQALYTMMVIIGSLVGAHLAGLQGVAVGVVAAVALNYLSMTRLCSKMIGVTLLQVLRAHFSGLLVAVLVAGGLSVAMPWLREATKIHFLVLIVGSVVAAVCWAGGVFVAARIAPQGVLARVLSYMRATYCARWFGGVKVAGTAT